MANTIEVLDKNIYEVKEYTKKIIKQIGLDLLKETEQGQLEWSHMNEYELYYNAYCAIRNEVKEYVIQNQVDRLLFMIKTPSHSFFHEVYNHCYTSSYNKEIYDILYKVYKLAEKMDERKKATDKLEIIKKLI